MTGEYPRVTDTFIQREIASLREMGVYVQTFSVRKPPDEHVEDIEIATSKRTTIYLFPPWKGVQSHLRQMFSSPAKYLSAIALALTTCPPGMSAMLRQVAYFVEAGILASSMRRHSLSHLHNHFSDSSCSVAAIAAEMGEFTFSFTMHGPGEFVEPDRWWIGEKIRRALFVICISYFCRSQAMMLSDPDCWEKLRIVHCGVDLRLFDQKVHSGDGHRLLFVGRLVPAKGLPILLEAIARVEDAMLDIAGDGPERGKLEERAAALNIAHRVRFHGYQSQLQVKQLLGEADAFVTSSFAEGVPVVLMEAMAAGIPVVAPSIAGIPELVIDGHTGLLVPPGDADAIAAAIRRLLKDPNLRNRLATEARRKVEQEFDVLSECRRLAEVMTSLIFTDDTSKSRGCLRERTEPPRAEGKRKRSSQN
jgi:glycosyltransferase involved in cell wall biosynthesis